LPSVISHPAVVLALAPAFAQRGVGPKHWLLGALCTVVPDGDTLGYFLGVPYGSVFGHRGLTHSLAFAFALALLVAPLARRLDPRASFRVLVAFLFLCAASHGLLDMLTDGGKGVALFAPFSNERHFFAWRPILVSPLGLSRFLHGAGLRVLASELLWVWLPSIVAGALLWYAGGKHRPEPAP
jgi:inner membrane protein